MDGSLTLFFRKKLLINILLMFSIASLSPMVLGGALDGKKLLMIIK